MVLGYFEIKGDKEKALFALNECVSITLNCTQLTFLFMSIYFPTFPEALSLELNNVVSVLTILYKKYILLKRKVCNLPAKKHNTASNVVDGINPIHMISICSRNVGGKYDMPLIAYNT